MKQYKKEANSASHNGILISSIIGLKRESTAIDTQKYGIGVRWVSDYVAKLI